MLNIYQLIVSMKNTLNQLAFLLMLMIYLSACSSYLSYSPKLDHAELNHAELNHAELNHAELNHAELNHAELNHEVALYNDTFKTRFHDENTVWHAFDGLKKDVTYYVNKILASSDLTSVKSKYKQGSNQQDNFISQFLHSASQIKNKRSKKALKIVLAHPNEFRFQLLITEVKYSSNQEPEFVTHEYRIDQEYFYPASAIKTYASLAALIYYKRQKKKYKWLTTNDALSYSSRRCLLKDQSNIKAGHATLEHEIKKTQIVSNNKAFNRVFNVLGSKKIHEILKPYFPSVRVYHRLSSNETYQECLKIPALHVCDSNSEGDIKISKSLLRDPLNSSPNPMPLVFSKLDPYTGFGDDIKSLKVGQKYKDMKTKRLLSKPLDFTLKNRASFYDFQRLNFWLYFNNKADPILNKKMDLIQLLGPTWLGELRHAMAVYPRHSINPVYQARSLSETRFKPLIRGIRMSHKVFKNDQSIYYFNKAGKAFGFHIDNAFIGYGKAVGKIDPKTGKSTGRFKKALFITVGVYANSNKILNDNKYQYDKITVPLLNAIGYAVGRYLIE
jgi:hypothetical protein